MKLLSGHGLGSLYAPLFGLLYTSAALADTILVANFAGSTIGEYTTSGATVNASLISGLSYGQNLALFGSDLFVARSGPFDLIREYTTSGATVNASLISGLNGPAGIAILTPEPSTIALLGLGLAALGLWVQR